MVAADRDEARAFRDLHAVHTREQDADVAPADVDAAEAHHAATVRAATAAHVDLTALVEHATYPPDVRASLGW